MIFVFESYKEQLWQELQILQEKMSSHTCNLKMKMMMIYPDEPFLIIAFGYVVVLAF